MRPFLVLVGLVLVGCGGHGGAVDAAGPDDLAVMGETDLASGDDLSVAEDLASVGSDLAGVDLAGADPCTLPSTGSSIAVVGAAAIGNTSQPITPPGAGPTFVSTRSATSVQVDYTVPFDAADATTAGNYVIAPALAVIGVTPVGNQSAILTTAAQTPGQSYTVTITNVRDMADAVAFAPATLAFGGYRFHASVSRNGMKSVGVFFASDTVACAAAQDLANYSLSGATVMAAAGSGCGGGRTAFVTLTLAAGLSAGKHTLTLGAALTDQLGAPPNPLAVTFDGPGDPSALYVGALDAVAGAITATFNVDVDPVTGAMAGNYTTTPALAIGNATVSAAPNGNQVVLAASSVANTYYTLATSGVAPAGGAAATVPSTAFWGAGSFFPNAIQALSPTKVRVYFSDDVGASAAVAGNYSVSGGVAVQMATTVGSIANLTVSPMSASTDYVIAFNGISSVTNVPLAAGYAGYLDVTLSAPVDRAALPRAYVGKAWLDGDYGTTVSNDGKHLYVGTGYLPSGVHSLKLCGLADAAHTTLLGATLVDFTVP